MFDNYEMGLFAQFLALLLGMLVITAFVGGIVAFAQGFFTNGFAAMAIALGSIAGMFICLWYSDSKGVRF